MQMSTRILEIEGHYLYLPNCMIVSFDDAQTHTTEVKLVRTLQEPDLGRLSDVHEIYKRVIHDSITVSSAITRLDEIMDRKARYPCWLLVIVSGLASASVGPFAFGARPIDIPLAFLLGSLVGFMQLVLNPMSNTYANLFEICATVLTSFLARAFGSIRNGELFCFSALAQSSIALILPGYIVRKYKKIKKNKKIPPHPPSFSPFPFPFLARSQLTLLFFLFFLFWTSMWSTRTSIQKYRCRLRSHGIFGDLLPLPRLRHHNWYEYLRRHGQIGYFGCHLYGRHAHLVSLVICTTLCLLSDNSQPRPVQADARHARRRPCRLFCKLFLRSPFQVERAARKHIRCFHHWRFGQLVFTLRSRLGSYSHLTSHICAGPLWPGSQWESSERGDERKSDYEPLDKWNVGEWYDNGQ